MKKRNPEATCGTCPYCHEYPANEEGPEVHECRRHAPVVVGEIFRYVAQDDDEETGKHDAMYLASTSYVLPEIDPSGWCGEHPDFFLEEPEEEPVLPKPFPFEVSEATKQKIARLNEEHDAFQRGLRLGFP